MAVEPTTFDYLPIERVIFGTPVDTAVAAEADRVGASRVFVVASNTLNRSSDVVTRVLSALDGRSVGLFDNCSEHSPREDVIEIADTLRRCEADLVVTIGGGTPIDTVKAALLCLTLDIHYTDEMSPFAMGGARAREIGPSRVRQIAVPTTLSGAEFSAVAGITDRKTNSKQGFAGPDLCPRAVVLDPSATLYTPEWLWLSTGLRAVDHAVEGYCSPGTQPYTEGLCLHALRLFAVSLRRNKSEPDDLTARLQSQQATWLAASGLGRVTMGASHGIGYILGAAHGVPHGLTSCVMLPWVLTWNADANADRQRAIAEALGRPDESAAAALLGLLADLNLPTRLRDVGIAQDQLDRIAELAVQHPVVRANPKPITSAAQVREILNLAY